MKRFVLMFFSLLGCILALIGCNSTDSKPIKIALNWAPSVEFGGFYAAVEHGYFKEEGLDVSLIIKQQSLYEAFDALLAKQADFSIVSADKIVVERASGKDVMGVYATFQHSPLAFMYHATSPFISLEQLWKSSNLIYAQDQAIYFRYLSALYGPTGLRVLAMDATNAAFIGNFQAIQQCYQYAEPTVMTSMGIAVDTILISSSGYDPYENVLVARGDLVNGSPELVAKVVRAVKRGWESYLDKPAPINEILAGLNPSISAPSMNIMNATLRYYIQNEVTKNNGLGAMTKERWEVLIDQLYKTKLIDKKIEANSVFVNAAS